MNGILDASLNTHAVRVDTPRLILREHVAEDLIPLHEMLSDPAVTWYIPDMYHAEPGETEAYLRSVLRDDEASLRMRFNLAVQERDNGRLAGSVALHVIDGGEGGAHYSLGYFIRRDLWNRGFATEAVRGALGFIFAADACRVSASCLAENLGSRRVLEKCGMTQEGLLKKHTWHAGAWKDCAVYAVLKEEFAKEECYVSGNGAKKAAADRR